MCTGRIDLSFILKAFSKGMDGVFIGGCWPGECHYLTEGNYLALSTVNLFKKLMKFIGINPDRLRLEWISAAEGNRFAELMNDFSSSLKETGPLNNDKSNDFSSRLGAVNNLIPYIKLVERERLRVPLKTVEEYKSFFESDDFNRLFQELITDKLIETQMMSLLRDKPLSTAEISKKLELTTSEVSRHINITAKQGMVRFNEKANLVSASCNNNSKHLKEAGTADNEKVDKIIDDHKGKPGSLIHVLMEVQSEYHWLPKEILNKISRELEVPLSRVMLIASFYKTFSLTPKGKHEVHVCTGTSCHLRGASNLLKTTEDLIGIRQGETDSDSIFSLDAGNCLGCCSIGPEIIVDGKHHPRVTPDKAENVLNSYK